MHGTDTVGVAYPNVESLWQSVAESLLPNGCSYWQSVEDTVEGVLGGYGHIANVDASASLALLRSVGVMGGVACDCGAGIGRVVKDVLLQVFDNVDLVEPDCRFVERARRDLAAAGVEDRVTFVCEPIQHFVPTPNRYACIWVQWVCGHLRDDAFISFLERCKLALCVGGVLCIKENNAPEKSGWVFDRSDFCLTRTDSMYRALFAQAGLTLVCRRKQTGFPKELLPVFTYVLQPSSHAPKSVPSDVQRSVPADYTLRLRSRLVSNRRSDNRRSGSIRGSAGARSTLRHCSGSNNG